MGLQNEHSIINLQYMKITGFYQLLIPSDGVKLFNINIYKTAFIVQILILSVTTIMGFYSIYAFINDVNQIFNYTIIIFAANFAIFKYYFIIKNAKTIWNFMHNMMSTNFLCYKGHTKEIYKIGRNRSSTLILISFGLWSNIVLYWSLSAILSKNSYFKLKFKDGVYNYRSNAIDLVYPVTDTFYNKYFLVFYLLETILLIFWSQMMWVFDILMISVCISIEHQLKTIAASYSLIGLNHNELTRNNKSTKNVEAILDLEVLIQDQQNILEKTKNMYQILKPATFIQLAAESFQIILQPCMILKLYFDGSLSPTLFFKLSFPEITYLCHLFLTCYLFSIVNEQKESMNFALYSSNWTAMSVKFKKLLLFTMRMNDAENLKMQISIKRMVNMEMFADVRITNIMIQVILL
nr:odorant receptor 24 [Myzus persicae]